VTWSSSASPRRSATVSCSSQPRSHPARLWRNEDGCASQLHGATRPLASRLLRQRLTGLERAVPRRVTGFA
jgi:hypothetical protein